MSRTQARYAAHMVRIEGKHLVRLHANDRTHDYLHSLARGAAVVDPGDLDPATEYELTRRTAEGELRCERNHGRRVWRKS